MTLLDLVAHQPRLPEQQLPRLKDRVLAMLRDDRTVAIWLSRMAAVVTGVMTPVALYFTFIALFPGLAATARVCVGTIPT